MVPRRLPLALAAAALMLLVGSSAAPVGDQLVSIEPTCGQRHPSVEEIARVRVELEAYEAQLKKERRRRDLSEVGAARAAWADAHTGVPPPPPPP